MLVGVRMHLPLNDSFPTTFLTLVFPYDILSQIPSMVYNIKDQFVRHAGGIYSWVGERKTNSFVAELPVNLFLFSFLFLPSFFFFEVGVNSSLGILFFSFIYSPVKIHWWIKTVIFALWRSPFLPILGLKKWGTDFPASRNQKA